MISGENVRETLITSNLDLADRLARRFSDRGESHEDLVQVASLALVTAAGRFDADRGSDVLYLRYRNNSWGTKATLPRSRMGSSPAAALQELSTEIGHHVNRLSQELGRLPVALELAEAAGTTEEDVLKALKASQGYRTSSLDARTTGGNGALFKLLGWKTADLPLLTIMPFSCERSRGFQPGTVSSSDCGSSVNSARKKSPLAPELVKCRYAVS